MVRTAIAALCLVALMGSFGQTYKPKTGETDLKLDIEGKGTVYIELFTKKAPQATAQIVKLVNQKFYDQQRFHRVDKTPKPYLIQIGDADSKTGNLNDLKPDSGGTGARIPFEESGHENVTGAVGLAHTVADPQSGDSQFYILLDTSKFLDGHYTVFGQVVSGMDVVNKVELGDRVTSASIVTG